jgi:SAM-dependent methyltransferase
MDPIAQFKENARLGWASFTPFEMITGTAAPHLVRFAGVTSGTRVLDVACGTGVVALTAARKGAHVSGVDLTPELIARAKENAALLKVEVDFKIGDAEELPYPDGSFDFVLSQFGHMFAPRPDVCTKELLRVLKPGGTIAFSTWPPELFTGRMFALQGKNGPPLPPGVSPPVQWGDPNVIRERLGTSVSSLTFDRATMRSPVLSPAHMRAMMEVNVGPLAKLVASLSASDPAKLATFRRDLEALVAEYFEDNVLRQDFLMTRALKS